MSYGKKLTNAELIAFLNANRHGILAFAGRTPYALPMGYIYREKTLLLCLTDEGKKMERIKKNTAVCYTICKPRWETEKLKTPCTSAVIEGKLEAVKDKSVYGLGSKKLENMTLYKLAIAEMGARKCNRKPCELFAGKSSAAIKAMVKKKA
jgi:nitroimidazol reductase NimA-like FMN-containing flavoprotein (pyridoxamine 5'-phosphate oxidase superfamily)